MLHLDKGYSQGVNDSTVDNPAGMKPRVAYHLGAMLCPEAIYCAASLSKAFERNGLKPTIHVSLFGGTRTTSFNGAPSRLEFMENCDNFYGAQILVENLGLHTLSAHAPRKY